MVRKIIVPIRRYRVHVLRDASGRAIRVELASCEWQTGQSSARLHRETPQTAEGSAPRSAVILSIGKR